MITFKDILKEITVKKPVPNNLQRLLALRKEINATTDEKRLSAIAIQCVELVLPIYEYYYPDDKRVKQTIDAAKEGYRDVAAAGAVAYKDGYNNAATYVARAAIYSANSKDTYETYAIDTVDSAIKATKLHFKLINEIKVNKPIPNNLQRLLALKKEIKATKDIKRLSTLAILCAELVLPIYEYYYPEDGKVKQTIEAAKQGNYYYADNAADNAVDNVGVDNAAYAAAAAAAYAAYAAYYASADYTAAAAADAAAAAIKATKLHF